MEALSTSIEAKDLLIDGQWIAASYGRRFETINPATGQVIASIAQAGAEDVHIAVMAARNALTGVWKTMAPAERARRLMRAADLLETRAEHFAMLECLDAGKPLSAARRQDVAAAIDCFRYYAGWADKISGEVVPVRSDALTYVTREPVGVVAAIVPWNFPLMNAAWKIAPALACGCTVVLKPAELTPLSALALGSLLLDAGIPPGVVNVVPGFGDEAGQALIEHPQVDKISFTGSPAVGKRIMATASITCKRVTLELGGKSPNLVFEDADIDAAVRASSSGIFFNAGQVCSAGSRIFVQRSIYDTFVDRLARRAQGIRLGDPLDPQTMMGPVISAKQRDRILSYIETGKAEGASVACGGKAPAGDGYFIEPTVFADADNDMCIAREEIFGPVATLIPFDDEADGIAQANDNAYSLAAALWTRDVSRAHRVSRALRAGMVWINTYGHTDTRLPWGGCGGDSGVGRDLGKAALENYAEQKSVWLQLG